MKKNLLEFVTIVAWLLYASVSSAATDWSTQDYDLYPGDFDGDGKTDLLYVARDASKASGIARSDGSGPNIPYQSWPSNYLGIPWHGNIYGVVVADFNNDDKDDVFLQRSTAGDSFLLLTDANGKISGISQTVANTALGLTWSADQHKLLAGDFNGDGRADLFLQARSPAGNNAVVVADANGQFLTGPLQTWTDSSWSAFKWSTTNSNMFVGDFNGDGWADLLIQARPKIVLVDYEIPIPVPTYPPNANGVVLAQVGATPFIQAGVQQWSRTANGVDWSPLTATVVVGDFDGDGRADVILQARYASRPSYLLTGNAGGAALGTGTALATNVTWASDSYRLVAGNFDGTGGAGIYYQAVSSGGTNAYANTVTGGSVSATTHNPATPTGVLPTTAVGNTPGSFAVSDDGAATYSIPIVVPPGIAGIQPNLALVYSSGLGSGSVGIGWRLSGLSEISRCSKTLVQDLSNDAVLLSTADRFCLDGNKLRVTNGSYGADGSTYQTEVETFARVTASVPGSNGPSWFKVESKDGLTYEYGNSTDSRIESTNPSASSTARTWALNKVSDRAGNFMTISYQEDGSPNGSFRPTLITYTQNPNTTPAATPAAYRVQFYWDTRPSTDQLLRYVGGGAVRENYRLSRIETEYNKPDVGWTLVRKYQLSYNTSGVSQRSRLSAVQECDTNAKCLAPTTIAWQEGTFGWAATASGTTTLPASASNGFPIDMNGDGRVDYAYFDTGTNYWRVMFANSGGGYDSPVDAYAGSASTYEWAMPIDANGDGRRDLLVGNPSDGKWWWVRHTTGTSFASSATTLTYTLGSFPADINGDGLDDIVSASGNVMVAFNASDGGAVVSFGSPAVAWTVPANSTYWSFGGASDFSTSDIQTADFNGDGREDVLVETREDLTGGEPGVPPSYLYAWHVLQSTGGSFTEVGTILSATFAMPRPLFTDVNADGLVDLVYDKSGTFRYRLSNGGLGNEVNTGVTTHGPAAVADCDGDGFPDLVAAAATAGNFICIKSDGAALATSAIDLGTAGGAKVADVNGDGLIDFVGPDSSNVMKTRLHRGVMPDLVSNVADGFGNTVAFTYAAYTDSSIRASSAGTPLAWPSIDVEAPWYVVRKYAASDGNGGSYEMSYKYAGARVHVMGRGSLGFATREWIDSRTQIKTVVSSEQTFPHIGAVKEASAYQSASGPLINRVTNTLATLQTGTTTNQQRWFPYVGQSVQNSYEVGGISNTLAVAQVTQSTTINSYGDPTVVTTLTADQTGSGLSYTTATTNTYATADTTNWCVSFVERQQIQSTVPGPSTETRTVDYTKDAANPAKCRASHEIIEPTDTTGKLKVTTQFGYDAFGHINSQTVNAQDVAQRATAISFGTQGIFPTMITNAESESTSNTYDFGLGVLKTTQDPNAQTASFDHDGFGRLTRAIRPDGTKTSFTFSACTIGNGYCGDSRLRYQVEAQELDNTMPGALIRSSRQLFDAVGRSLYEQSQTFSGAYATIATNYDSQGRLSQRSQPYFPGGPVFFSTVSYDLIGRPTSEQRRISEADSDSQSTAYAYDRLTYTQSDPNTKQTATLLNAVGQVVQVTETNGATTYATTYAYGPFGNLKKTVDPSLNEIVNTFNLRGFKTQTKDPDMGTWNYDYYATGELRWQENEKDQTVTFEYDGVSRIKKRTDPGSAETNFAYGGSASAPNVGKLLTVTAPGNYEEHYTYDAKSRLEGLRTVIDATDYVMTNGYNATTGLLETTTYPTSTNAVAGSRFKVKYEYANGLLQRTRDFNSPSTIYWERVATNAAGQTIDEQLGNGLHTYSTYDAITGLLGARTAGATSQVQNLSYQYDKVGNLTQRKDQSVSGQTRTEDFWYDDLYRMYESKLDGTINLQVGYSAVGNITSKTGVGTYTYPTSGASSIRPHGVSAIGASSYSYDSDADDQGNGNMTSRAGDSITWHPFDKPNVINKGSNSSQFFYGADRSRFKQVATIASGGPLTAGTETTLYVAGGMFEKVTKSASGVTEYKHYIPGESGAVAIRTLRAGSSTVNDTRYLHKDNLGSLTVITDESAGVVARLSYDAFGNRRDGTSWSGSPTSGEWTAIQAVTHRGFTFHEHLDNVDAIHMNGRVFDPKLARFLSADPFVQSPGFSQSFNRYSYTFNNPLSYVDPSGYAARGPDDAEQPEVRPSLPMFPDWGGGVTNQWYGAGVRNALMRGMCNAHPDWCMRRVRPYERVETYSGRTVGAVNGAVFGARNIGPAARPYTLEEPVELAGLRRAHPELDRAIEGIWADSFRGAPHEEELLVYQSRATGRLLFNTTTLVPDGDSELTWANSSKPYFPHYRGYTLVLTVHTHPFQFGHGSNALQCYFVKCAQRGPSDLDIATSKQYPYAFHMIVGVGYRGLGREHYYYGERANIDE